MDAPQNDLPSLIRPEHGPDTQKATPWGGGRIAPLHDEGLEHRTIGESLEFSTLPGLESRALGRKLSNVLGRSLPFIVKRIDTAAPLSIQVHPEDDPASGTLGKEEAWVILEATEDAYVLAGVARGVDHDALQIAMRRAIDDPEDAESLVGTLERIPVSRGMVILVPAGTVHSIGPGILLAEIQQPVDRTFRLFDYGSERPIHPELASAVWQIGARPEVWRPGDPMYPTHPIEGRHLSLQVWGPGDMTMSGENAPQLLVSIGSGISASIDAAPTVSMAHGELLLHVHGALRVHIEPDAMLVTGCMGPR